MRMRPQKALPTLGLRSKPNTLFVNAKYLKMRAVEKWAFNRVAFKKCVRHFSYHWFYTIPVISQQTKQGWQALRRQSPVSSIVSEVSRFWPFTCNNISPSDQGCGQQRCVLAGGRGDWQTLQEQKDETGGGAGHHQVPPTQATHRWYDQGLWWLRVLPEVLPQAKRCVCHRGILQYTHQHRESDMDMCENALVTESVHTTLHYITGI